MPLLAKASDQASRQGQRIFDPVGTNEFIKSAMVAREWSANIRIPADYQFLGLDVDLGRHGLIGEVQFSNYPYQMQDGLFPLE